MNPKFISCWKALAFIALAALTMGVLATPAFADTCGKGKISNVTPAASTNSAGNQFWNVLPGSTVTVTLSCVTDCAHSGTDATIQVIVQSSASGNKCITANKVSTGVYTFIYCVPLTGCQTDVISYCTTGCSTSTGMKALDAGGKCPGHLRVASSTGADCTPQISGANCGGTVELGCNPTTTPNCSNAATLAGGVTGSTSCGTTLPVSCTAGSVTTSGCNRSQKFTFGVSNDCGQTASCVVTLKWKIVSKPTLAGVPSGGDKGCNPDPLPSCDNSVTASDECGSVNVTCTPGDITSDGCNRTRKFTYSATNCAGTTSQCVTYTWKEDMTPPELHGVPDDTTVECDAVPDPPTVTVTDNCDTGLTVHYDQKRTDGDCPNNYKLVRTWSAQDACGNPVSASQTITVQDTTAPILNNLPTGNDLGCNPDPTTLPSCDPNVTATDNCDGDVSVDCKDGGVVSDGCKRSQTFTYSAKDSCGNPVSQDVTYTWTEVSVKITCPPPANACLADFIAGKADTGTATAVDSCDNPVDESNISFVDSDPTPIICDLGPGFTITRTWTATVCGATASCDQVITVCPCEPQCVPFGQGCTVTLGFWKTHGPGDCIQGHNSNQWPTSGIVVVGCDSYDLSNPTDTATLCGLLSASGQHLVPQLIAAQLNLLNGSLDGGANIQAVIDAANACICTNGADACVDFTTALDNYNSGITGPGHCGTCDTPQ